MSCAGSKGDVQDPPSSAQPTVTVSARDGGATVQEESASGGRDFSELRVLAVVVLIAWGLFRNAVG